MTESGFSSFPQSERVLRNQVRRGERSIEAQIIDMPSSIKGKGAVRVRGEIVTINSQGVAHVQTEYGDLAIKIPSGVPFKVGEAIEIFIRPDGASADSLHVKVRAVSVSEISLPQDTMISADTFVRTMGTPVDVAIGQTPLNPQTNSVFSSEGSAYIFLMPSSHSFSVPVPFKPLSAEAIPDLSIQAEVVSISKVSLAPVFSSFVLDNGSLFESFSDLVSVSIPKEKQSIFYFGESYFSPDSPLLSYVASANPVGVKSDFFDDIKAVSFEPLKANLTVGSASVLELPSQVSEELFAVEEAILELWSPDPVFSRAGILLDPSFPSVSLVPTGEPSHVDYGFLKYGDAHQNTAVDDFLHVYKAGFNLATIEGFTAQNFPIVKVFDVGYGQIKFYLVEHEFPEVVTGAVLHFVPAESGSFSESLLFVLQPLAIDSSLSAEPWPLMIEIYNILSAHSPSISQSLSVIYPNLSNSASLPSAVMFFIAAVQGGDVGNWLGQRSLDVLREAGREDLIVRLQKESRNLIRVVTDPSGIDWRAVSLPLFGESEVRQMTLYYRQDDNEADQAGELRKSTRFIFNLDLSAIGSVQLDGLLTRNRMDLILRTQATFSFHMQAEMREVYAEALRHTGITGELSFQTGSEKWVHIQAQGRRFGMSA